MKVTVPRINDDTPDIYWQLKTKGFQSDEERLLRWIHGRITLGDVERNGLENLGEIAMCWIQVGNLMNETSDPRYVCDMHSMNLRDVWDALYPDSGYDLHPRIEKRYEDHVCANSSDILYIESVVIGENFRGKGVGQWAVASAVELFGDNCTFIILKPFPLEYDGYQNFAFSQKPHEQALAADPEFDVKIETAFARVERFYEHLGFRQLPRIKGEESDFWVYCPLLGDRQPRARKGKPFRLNRHACRNCKAMQAFHDHELCEACRMLAGN